LVISDKKNNSPEDRINGTSGYCQWNFACSEEQKTFGIPYQTFPWKRKQLRIPFRGTKIEAKRSKSENCLLNCFTEEKTTRSSVEQKQKQTLPF
jgi:hypothetical protein